MLVATPFDLSGDRSVIARAEAVAPAVAAASDEIEQDRRLPATLLDKLHEAQLFRLLKGVLDHGGRFIAPHHAHLGVRLGQVKRPAAGTAGDVQDIANTREVCVSGEGTAQALGNQTVLQ